MDHYTSAIYGSVTTPHPISALTRDIMQRKLQLLISRLVVTVGLQSLSSVTAMALAMADRLSALKDQVRTCKLDKQREFIKHNFYVVALVQEDIIKRT